MLLLLQSSGSKRTNAWADDFNKPKKQPKKLGYKSAPDDDDDDDDEIDLDKMYNTSYLFAYRTRVPEVTVFDARKANENGEAAFIFAFVKFMQTREGKMFLPSIGVKKGVGHVAVRANPDENIPQKNAKGWSNKVRFIAFVYKPLILILTNTHKIVSVMPSMSWKMITLMRVAWVLHMFHQIVYHKLSMSSLRR